MDRTICGRWLGALLAACLAHLAGCETNSDVSGTEDGSGDPAFSISPSAVTLRVGDTTVKLSAVGGVAPFAWRVSDATLGTVPADIDTRAVTYTSTGVKEGINTVTVTDDQGWSASALIIHGDKVDTAVTVTPATVTLSGGTNTQTFTASQGNAPYSWSVDDTSLASIVPVHDSDATQGLLTRVGAGTGRVNVTVRDSVGQTATAVVFLE